MLSEILEEIKQLEISKFMKAFEETSKILEFERSVGKMNSFSIYEDLILTTPANIERCIIIGDIHGDLATLIEIFKKIDLDSLIKEEKSSIVFLGDYGDRGEYSVEVYYTLLKLKSKIKEKIILLRGNHEGPQDLLAQPHDLPIQFVERFGQRGYDAYLSIRKFFDKLYLGFAVLGKFLALHGGIPSKASYLEEIAIARKIHPKKRLLEEILWNDPMDEEGLRFSYRGAGMLFGKDITEKFLKKNNLIMLIRGHEPAEEGYFLSHDGMVLTVFSRKGKPYYNKKAAFLDINIREFQKKEDIEKFIITL